MSIKKAGHAQIQINWSQVVTALIIGAIGGAVTILRVADTQTVVVAGIKSDVDGLKADYMPRTEIEREFTHINQSLVRIEGKLDRLQ